MDGLKVSILSPRGKLFEGPAAHVRAAGAGGAFGVLPGHAPLIATLTPGLCKVEAESGASLFYTGQGVLEVAHDEVVLLVDEGEPVDTEAAVADRILARSALVGKRASPGGWS